MEIKFEPSKLKTVDIRKVKPNSWNPKDKNTEEYRRIKRGLQLKGQRLPVIVREVEDYYEIIDGEQRWTSCSELGFSEILIYNEGDLPEKEAKELTIWYEQQVPFNEIKLAELVSSMVSEYADQDLEIPYAEEEVQQMVELVQFNWDDYEPKQEHVEGRKNEEDGLTKLFKVDLEEGDFLTLVNTLDDVKKKHKGATDAVALMLIVNEYLISKEPVK